MHTLDGESVTLTPAMKMMMGWTSLFSPVRTQSLRSQSAAQVGDTHGGFRAAENPAEGAVRWAVHRRHRCQYRASAAFKEHELTVDFDLARPACRASTIQSRSMASPYWDGWLHGQTRGLPALPHECPGRDILLVLINSCGGTDAP